MAKEKNAKEAGGAEEAKNTETSSGTKADKSAKEVNDAEKAKSEKSAKDAEKAKSEKGAKDTKKSKGDKNVKESKSAKGSKKESKKPGKVRRWFKDLKTEFSKVVWPSGKTVFNNSVVVFAMMLGFALLTFVLDEGFLALLQLAIGSGS